jgi:hypothetical protein
MQLGLDQAHAQLAGETWSAVTVVRGELFEKEEIEFT